ncbi:hypothetical protein EHF33_03135 [Deinococcus psychrotolerans]|uniref:HEPN domain-containing protein n=1 Tax=Deinococcus psychrotolerans TaxID=2489213 RepID=A0A3G8YCD7_9DEIO|nr:hypothetical protein [Deinococcus psychrotolerans]AZI41867.1 hypothetical protein EHF33_03135 [Deinococcus psychrotolerans]
MSKQPPRTINRKSLFRNAESYLEAAFALGAVMNHRLETMPPNKADEALKILEPTILCEALACELYFKLYINLTGGHFDRVHGLHDLYKALSMPNREKLGMNPLERTNGQATLPRPAVRLITARRSIHARTQSQP